MIILPESDQDLLRECEVETFRSSGPGGQHVNKTESAVLAVRSTLLLLSFAKVFVNCRGFTLSLDLLQ